MRTQPIGLAVTPGAQQIADEYKAETGAAVSERTVRRAVQNAGGKWVGKGVYALPPLAATGTHGHADATPPGREEDAS